MPPKIPDAPIQTTPVKTSGQVERVSAAPTRKAAAIAAIRPRVSAGRGGDTILGCLIVCVLLGGQQIQFLRPTVYQETIDWAHAFAMGFVWLAVRDVATHERIRTATLLPMAMLFVTNRMEPSTIPALTPPVCLLRAY